MLAPFAMLRGQPGCLNVAVIEGRVVAAAVALIHSKKTELDNARVWCQVRCSIVCSGAAQILEVMGWLLQSELQPCRVKNKFAMASDELVGGYRDLMVCFLFEDSNRHAAPAPIKAC